MKFIFSCVIQRPHNKALYEQRLYIIKNRANLNFYAQSLEQTNRDKLVVETGFEQEEPDSAGAVLRPDATQTAEEMSS